MERRLAILILIVLAFFLTVFWLVNRSTLDQPQDDLSQAIEAVMAEPTPLFHDKPIPENTVADWVRVEKAARRLTLLGGGQPLKHYSIALGWNPEGPKEREGDGRTPEGLYFISGRNSQSKFHLSLRISYPSPDDIARAAAGGYPPGSDIMIHGLPNGMTDADTILQGKDWTAGCVAVTNEEIEEIWRVVPDGTPVEILP